MSTTIIDKSTDANQDLHSVISSNLKRLIVQNKTTQKELADKLGVAAASMTDYCKGKRIPSVEFFVALRNLYNISIDDFLTKSINPSTKSLPSNETSFDNNIMEVYRKYCGTYFTYYFDTKRYKGKNTQSPKDSILFGILFIYENPSSLSIPKFSCAAVLGINERESVTVLKKTLDNFHDPASVLDYINNKYSNGAYYGDFELSQEHAFVNMSHTNTDKALLIFHRVDNNKPNYTGGIGTINSISKGRERTPVVQFMGISRYPLTMSIEEIHHCLLLNYPIFQTESETEEMIQSFKTLYVDSDDSEDNGFTEYQKSIIVKSTLERFIKKSLERNVFRYGKISEQDDDEWYHAIKASSINNGDR